MYMKLEMYIARAIESDSPKGRMFHIILSETVKAGRKKKGGFMKLCLSSQVSM